MNTGINPIQIIRQHDGSWHVIERHTGRVLGKRPTRGQAFALRGNYSAAAKRPAA